MNFNTVNHCVTVTAALHRCYVECYPRDVQDATERCCVVCVPVRRYTVDIYTVSTPRRYLHSPAWISTAPDRELRRKWWTESPCRHSTPPTQQSYFSYFSLWVIVSNKTWICGQVSQSQVETPCRNLHSNRRNLLILLTFPPLLGSLFAWRVLKQVVSTLAKTSGHLSAIHKWMDHWTSITISGGDNLFKGQIIIITSLKILKICTC